MTWANVAIAGASLIGGALSANASKNASQAATQGGNAAIAEQRRQFDTAMSLQRPYSVTGTAALNQLAQLYGLPYSPYQDPSTAGGGSSFTGGGVTAGSNNRIGYTMPNPAGALGFVDPITSYINGGEPNYQWDAKRGVVDVNGRSGGIAGGYIDPSTGEVWVATPGTKNRDAALSDAATAYLRTGEGDMSNPALKRFADAIGSMGQNGYKYTAPAQGTNADGTPSDNGITTPSGPSMAGFFASPDYTFRRDEGMRGLERSAAARGGAFSGNAIRGLADFNSNLAAGEYGNYFNRLANIAGIGQTAANNGSQMAMTQGQNIGGIMQQQGQDRASGIMGQSNAWSGAVNSGLNNYLLYRGGYFNRPAGG